MMRSKSISWILTVMTTIIMLHPAASHSDLRAAPQFTCCPEIVRVQVGDSLKFSLDVSDTAIAADYRWSLTLLSPNVPSFSVTVDSLTGLVSITNPNLSVSPNFDYRLVVSDSSGSADSCDFPLQVVSVVIGDMNNNGRITVTDATWIMGWLWAGWPAPYSSTAADANCTGEITISDAVYLLLYIFDDGPEPCTPCPW